MVGFGELGSGAFSLSACCARQILEGKNATTTNKMKNWQRRKFKLSFGRMKCAATHHLSTAIRIPRSKQYTGTCCFMSSRRKASGQDYRARGAVDHTTAGVHQLRGPILP